MIGINRDRPDDAVDGGQALERAGRVHGVAEPARERQGDVHRQLLPAPQRRAARAVARQRHGQPRHPPPGDVRRRREHGRRRSGASGRRSARSRSAASIRRSPSTCAAEIKIEDGDDFDFLKLQKDIDRIREAFNAQGFLEARVRTRRVEAADGTRRRSSSSSTAGRARSCEIDGVVAPSSLVDELEEAWHKNVFDQFLIDDLTNRVRRYLVDSNDLASVVVGQIDRPDAGYQAAADRRHARRAGHRPRDPVCRQPASSMPSGSPSEIVDGGSRDRSLARSHASSRRRCGRSTTRRVSSRPRSSAGR